MSNPNRKTGSVIFLSLFIGLIIISFMIGDMGVGGMQTTADTLAKVGDTNIRMKEFQTEYNRQLQFYSQFMGGKALTRKQIEQFKIKENTLNNLVQRLLAVELSESLGATPAGDEIKKEIKSQEYFQTNKQFDLNRYKSVLKANAYSPDEYEKLIEKDLRRKKIDGLFSGFT
ncbi:MAG: SurA N-terminal domain-containing protein, partial [Bacteriovoracaceae bacterium]